MDTPSVVSRIAWRSCAGAIREKRPRQDAEHYNYFRIWLTSYITE
jgi:hypothetical protein